MMCTDTEREGQGSLNYWYCFFSISCILFMVKLSHLKPFLCHLSLVCFISPPLVIKRSYSIFSHLHFLNFSCLLNLQIPFLLTTPLFLALCQKTSFLHLRFGSFNVCFLVCTLLTFSFGSPPL